MDVRECPFCREEIKICAIKCKHCGSSTVEISQNRSAQEAKEKGTLWLPVPSLIIGIIISLALFDDSDWLLDEVAAALIFSVFGFILGVISISIQKIGRGMAVAGVIFCSIAIIAYIFMLIDIL